MTEPLATIERLIPRVPGYTDTPEDIATANEFLEDASGQARFEANRPEWTATTAPAVAVNIVLAAAARAFNNPEGFDRERFDATDIERHEDSAPAAVVLTKGEVRMLRRLGKQSGFKSIPASSPDRFISRADGRRSGKRVYNPDNPFSADSG